MFLVGTRCGERDFVKTGHLWAAAAGSRPWSQTSAGAKHPRLSKTGHSWAAAAGSHPCSQTSETLLRGGHEGERENSELFG